MQGRKRGPRVSRSPFRLPGPFTANEPGSGVTILQVSSRNRIHASAARGDERDLGPSFRLSNASHSADRASACIDAHAVNGYRNEQIRRAVLDGLNGHDSTGQEFARVFPEVASGDPIDITMVARAIAEFQISLTFMNAPIDPRYAITSMSRNRPAATTRPSRVCPRTSGGSFPPPFPAGCRC